MLEEAEELAKDGMDSALDRLKRELARIRTGRATPSILEPVRVDSYGSIMPLNQVGTISVADARMLVVKPFDRNNIAAIEKAIGNAGLGLNPQSDGVVVRIPIPMLTDERRKELVKQANDAGEEAKITMRQARRDANDLLKKAEKDKEISEDDCKRGLSNIQELTDAEIKKVDSAVKAKEAEITGD